MHATATDSSHGYGDGRRLRQLPQLDGLRGLAIASVVAYHFAQDHFGNRYLRGGFLGVDLFFVLSGFLITCLLLQGVEPGHGIQLRQFYIRRMRRLLPAAWSMVIPVTLLLLMLGRRFSKGVLLTGITSLGYVTNWAPFLPGAHPFELAHMWSLAVEEQFYLLWPLILILWYRWRLSPRLLVTGTAVTLLALTLTRSALAWAGTPWEVEYLATPLHCDGLLLGALVGQSFVFNRLAPWTALGRRFRIPLILAILIEVSFLGQFGRAAYLFGITSFVLMAALLMAGVIDGAPSPFCAILSSPVLRWLGLRSYSIYLWSLPLEYFLDRISILNHGSVVGAAGVVATSFLFAEASYRLVETRFRDHTPPLGHPLRREQPSATPQQSAASTPHFKETDGYDRPESLA